MKDYFGPLEEEEESYRPMVPQHAIDLTGQRFGKWIVLERVEKYLWRCLCDCGTIETRGRRGLTLGTATRCKPCHRADRGRAIGKFVRGSL